MPRIQDLRRNSSEKRLAAAQRSEDNNDQAGEENEQVAINQVVMPQDQDGASNNEEIITTKEDLLAKAKASHKQHSKQKDFEEALDILRSQPDGEVNLEIQEIKKFEFTESEELQLLNLFIENPIQKQSADQTLRFMEGVKSLGKTITSADAERLKSHLTDCIRV